MESTDSSGGPPPPPPPQPNLPPGFRFHPTDEELVVHYLKPKTDSVPLPVAIITDVDLYKFDPWELPAKASFGEQEWYFFSPRDRKYPNGARPNRAATSGYWKATGTDKPVISTRSGSKKIGVKKALVFYSGKPPKGVKSDWIMHEYRLTDNKPTHPCDFGNKKNSLRLDDWVLCRIYKKNNNITSRHHHHHHHHLNNHYHHDMMIDDDLFRHVPPSFASGFNSRKNTFPAVFSNNNDTTAIYDGGGGGGNYLMNQNLASSSSGSKQEQLLPPMMMMKQDIPTPFWEEDQSQDPVIGKRFSGGVGDCSNIVSNSMAPPPLMQQQGGVYQMPSLNWYS